MDTSNVIAIAGAGAAAAVAVGYAAFVETVNVQVREIELEFKSLPEAFDGYTILHLSDMHINKLGRLEKRVMELVGKREVDACVVTGDVTANPRASDLFRKVCSPIKRKDPIFLSLGNSEHKPWVDTHILSEALTFDGCELLLNSSARIERGGQSVRVVGVDDPFSRLHDMDAAFAGVDPNEFIIFLTHCPSVTPEGIKRGANLILAGHTHGGQMRIPCIGVLWSHMRANKVLNDGLYTADDLQNTLSLNASDVALYVHRGIGTSRIFARFLVPPEIVYVTLRKHLTN